MRECEAYERQQPARRARTRREEPRRAIDPGNGPPGRSRLRRGLVWRLPRARNPLLPPAGRRPGRGNRPRGGRRRRIPAGAPGEGRPHRPVGPRRARRGRGVAARARRPGRDRRGDRPRRARPTPFPAGSGHLPRLGQGPRARRDRRTPRGRHRHRRLRARPFAEEGAGGRRRRQGHRPHRADPRHLRAARHLPRGQGPGRAGPARIPPSPPARLGRVDVPAGGRARRLGSRDRLARTGRDPAGARPPPHPHPHGQAPPRHPPHGTRGPSAGGPPRPPRSWSGTRTPASPPS